MAIESMRESATDARIQDILNEILLLDESMAEHLRNGN